MGTDPDAAPCIKALACVFKLAQGVNATLGDHLASRQKQSVSIETTTPHTNIGVLRPSTGELVPILEPTDEILAGDVEAAARGTRRPCWARWTASNCCSSTG